MARGKQLDNETVYKIMSSYFTTNNYTETSRQLNIPLNTVYDIVDRNITKPEFVELQNKTRRKYSKDFEEILDLAITRLKTEIAVQDKIPVSQLSTVIGTVYDKNRLENDESTENTNQTIKIGFSDEVQELSK